MIRHLNHFENGIYHIFHFALRLFRQLKRKRDIVPYRHRRKKRVILKDRMNAALIRREIRYILPFEIYSSGIRSLKTAKHTQERRLAAARRT